MKKLRTGVLGLGFRGYMYLDYVMLYLQDLDIVAIADPIEERLDKTEKLFEERNLSKPARYTSSFDLMENEDLDCVFIFTPWDSHVRLAIKAMELNIPVAMEVGGAYDLHEIWSLVDTYERTQTPFMMLENCNYGRLEMMTLNMVEQGVLGDIVFASGGYKHDLRDEVAEGYFNKHYRLDNYRKRNSHNYPSHELGPIAKILGINQGNRFISLTSQASHSKGIEAYIEREESEKVEPAKGLKITQSDIVVTNLKCANGQLVSLTLDTSLPRYYSRSFNIQGTMGMVNEENRSVFLEADTSIEDHFAWTKNFNNLDKYYEKYDHPVWKAYLEEGVQMGHGGMDYLVVKDFIEHLREGRPMPIDVYDAAVIMAVTALSEESLALGGHPVYFPDFTKGKWIYDEKSFFDKNRRL